MNSSEFKLSDGRIVQQSPSGRFRDKHTGKWVSKADAESLRLDPPCGLSAPGDPTAQQTASSRDYALEAVEQAVRQQGHEVRSSGEAWGKVIQVQAEIALDKNNASKSTAAAKLLAQATGIMDESEGDKEEQAPWFVLGRELAREMLGIIQDERSRREGENED
jgi:hypothetical protein